MPPSTAAVPPLTATADDPTRWDLSNVYSALDGPDYLAAVSQLDNDLTALAGFFDEHGVRRLADPPPAADDALLATLVGAVERTNSMARLADTLESFAYAFLSTNSYDPLATREVSRLELMGTRRKQLGVRLVAWIGSLGGVLEVLIERHPLLQEHAFFLRHAVRQSRFLMAEEVEALAAELSIDAGGAFGKLQGTVTSQLKVRFPPAATSPTEKSSTEQMSAEQTPAEPAADLVPITVVRNYCFHPDPVLREQAHRVELAGWHSIRSTVAACLNGVKGTALTLARRRGWPSVLDQALEQNRIDRPTLDALLGSIREALPDFRRYLGAKARRLGKPALPWWDLFAPVGSAQGTAGQASSGTRARKFNWREARDFLVDKFARFDPELSQFAAGAFDRRWIDGQPRDGKRGGAFCMAVVGVEESRILANFDGSFDQVSTLAHELGHGWHNACQRGLPPLRRGSPSTLAETASIFCETLIAEAALGEASREEQLTILDAQLSGATQVCVDISSRYLFETALFERRAQCELTPDELCELMLAAQRETYGDGLDPATYHRYMWLWKPHYYAHEENFYNFPYAFGHLFALGLYALYRHEGASFVPRYRELLRCTAQDYAAPLAARFGIDITQPDFWRASLAIVREQAERYAAI